MSSEAGPLTAGRGISGVADGGVAGKRIDVFGVEDVRHQPHPPAVKWRRAKVGNGDAPVLLGMRHQPSMREQMEIKFYRVNAGVRQSDEGADSPGTKNPNNFDSYDYAQRKTSRYCPMTPVKVEFAGASSRSLSRNLNEIRKCEIGFTSQLVQETLL